MRWNSPWGEGFPGWHLECSAMSTKYLGKTFDIHGGGNDLKFPHHENEVAQNQGACGCAPANYWLHTNMLLMHGRKMSKSDGNTITPEQLFTGDSEHISKAYSPMMLRFFMLQSHYRSTLDITDEALLAAEKGYRRLMEANKVLKNLSHPGASTDSELGQEINNLIDSAHEQMSDDFNTPMALARLFEMVSKINGLKEGHLSMADLSATTFERMQTVFHDFIFTIMGLTDESDSGNNNGITEGLMNLILDIRQSARENKDWATSDKIRDTLKELKIVVKDGKDGTNWGIE
jgi:cysteinyl-tRNA synthetase